MSCCSSNRRLALASALALGIALAGCSDIYYDRRETVAFGGNDAVAVNQAVQTIDPWPRVAENRNLATNGQVAASAIERYRLGIVYPPRGGNTVGGYAQQQQQPQPAAPNPSASAIK
jgi:hypothetical protein